MLYISQILFCYTTLVLSLDNSDVKHLNAISYIALSSLTYLMSNVMSMKYVEVFLEDIYV